MKTSDLLRESAATPKAPKMSDFPKSVVILSGLTPFKRTLTKFEESLDQIALAINSGEVVNTALVDIKHYVDKFVEYVFDTAFPGESFGLWVDGERVILPDAVNDCLYGRPNAAREIPSYVKKLSKVPSESKSLKFYKDGLVITKELMPLVEVMAWLKEHTIKASEKKKQEKEAKAVATVEKHKAHTMHKDMKKVINLLKSTAKDIEDNIFQAQHKMLKFDLAQFKKNCGEQNTTNYIKMYKEDPYMRFFVQNIIEPVEPIDYKDRQYKLIKNVDAKLESGAKRTAADIVDHFVYKNSGKLAHIITTKNNMKAVTISNVKVSRGAVECDLFLTFTDGSEFTANSSVVRAVSSLGKLFYRYPTIFRNVKLSDGSRLVGPSEDKMDKTFAKIISN